MADYLRTRRVALVDDRDDDAPPAFLERVPKSRSVIVIDEGLPRSRGVYRHVTLDGVWRPIVVADDASNDVVRVDRSDRLEVFGNLRPGALNQPAPMD